MSVVTVLTPNGRRQNVKITPNTTLLQVLEEVCLKHGLKPQDYDIRHHNKILDISCIFQFSGLPNNAFLEMVETKNPRLESPVILGIQLESGDRHMGEFSPSDNLWNVISVLNPQEAESFQNPVVIYMRKEVSGKENLQKTTLRSLGLTGGRAVLRFINKTSEELHTQANVSRALSRPASKAEKDRRTTTKSPERPLRGFQPTPQTVLQRSLEESKPKSKKGKVTNSNLAPVCETDGSLESGGKATGSPKDPTDTTQEPGEKTDGNVDVNETEIKMKNVHSPPGSTVNNGLRMDVSEDDGSKVILLGERNAVAYNLNRMQPMVVEEMPDDFYDLTVADAKFLLRDAKQMCSDLEDAPLMTAAQRELEKNKKILSLLNQYKKTVLRIKFPDRTVLQGTFSSVEKISAVEKFVSEYLQNPNTSFYLYTTPPKEILKPDSNLLESNCVPSAVLYFGVSTTLKETQFLRTDVLEKFSSPSAAALTAFQSRGIVASVTDEKTNAKENPESEAGPSISSTSTEDKESRDPGNSPPFKVPKWFRIRK